MRQGEKDNRGTTVLSFLIICQEFEVKASH